MKVQGSKFEVETSNLELRTLNFQPPTNMALLSYSFCMAMLHSLWQAGALLLFYFIIDKALLQKHSPLVKRNFLFVLLATQLSLFIITFLIYLFAGGNDIASNNIASHMPQFLSADAVYSVTPWLFSAYVLILSWKIIRALYTWHCFKQQYKIGLQKPSIELKLFAEQKAHQFGIKRKVKLWFSNTINTPVTFGFLRPVILLPVALMNNISASQAETLILHELAHIRTNDYLLNWFLLSSETIFFFNPFIALACRRIRLEREQFCDITVIAFEYKPALYAEALLQAERIKQMIPGFQLAAVSKKKQLLRRIHFFSKQKDFKQGHRIGIIAPLIGIIFFIAMYSFVIFPSNGNQQTTTASIESIPDIPYSNGDLNTAFANNVSAAIEKSGFVDEVMKRVEKQRPALERQMKKLQPMIRSIQAKAEKFAENITENFAMPVAVQENDATREIVIREETSGSKSASVRVYQLSYQDGKWILQPKMMVTANAILPDSLSGKKDSGVKRLLPPQ